MNQVEITKELIINWANRDFKRCYLGYFLYLSNASKSTLFYLDKAYLSEWADLVSEYKSGH